MASYCVSRLLIMQIEEETKAEIKKNLNGDNGDLDFNAVIPMPEGYANISSRVFDLPQVINGKEYQYWRHDESGNMIGIEESEWKELKEKHGSVGWQNWCQENWGTEGNADRVRLEEYDDELVYHFETKYTPCTPIVKRLSEMYPAADFILTYECGGDHWVFGCVRGRNGEVIECSV